MVNLVAMTRSILSKAIGLEAEVEISSKLEMQIMVSNHIINIT